MNNVAKKKIFNKLTIALLIIMLIFSAAYISGFSIKAKADTAKETEFEQTLLSIANSGFSSSSGSFPATPSSWTESAASGVSKGSTVAGVLDLDTFNTEANIKTAKLDKYPEYKDILPQTPFGTEPGKLGDSKPFLMINTSPSTATAYGYTSSSVSLSSNKFYMISAWVKTGNFRDNSGASIRLNGLGGDYAINRINTVSQSKSGIPYNSDNLPELENDPKKTLGWREYSFIIATSPLENPSLSITLSVGDYYSGKDEDGDDVLEADYASGYAFFDNVQAYEISASDFNDYSKAGNLNEDYDKIIDLSLKTAFENDTQEKAFNFVNIERDWTSASDNPKNKHPAVISANADLGSENAYNLENNPVSSTGRQNNDSYLDNVMIISSYNTSTENYINIASGKESGQLTIPRFSYYRLSFWVKTDNVNGGSGATAVLVTNKPAEGSVEDMLEFTQSNLSGDSANKARYGWKEYAFYINGSSIQEYKVSLKLCLGLEDNESSGTAMFHNVRFDKLTYTQYSSYSSSGTIVTFDSAFANNSKGVTNGAFYLAGDYKEYKFPLAPASWEYITAANSNITNYSTVTSFIDDKNIVSGIMPVDNEHFVSQAENYAKNNIINPLLNETGNVLVMSSTAPTAFAYRSTSFTITAGTSQKIAVTLRTDFISGYGASLILRSGSNIIATIENITDTYAGHNIRGFETFYFYVEGGLSDSEVTLDIWLGMVDRAQNNTKLSSGNIYVSQVSSEALSDTESFSTFFTAYENAKSNSRKIKAAAYTFKTENFSAYDYYDTSFIKYPYNWSVGGINGSDISTVKYGIFDSTNFISNQSDVPSYFKNSKNAVNNGVLMLHNTVPTASKLSLNQTFSLNASSWYKISVSIKTDLNLSNSSSIGAGIVLTGTDYKFEDIKDTTTTLDTITDKETFKTFNFYISTGEEAVTTGIEITLGGNKYSDEAVSGRVYVNNIEFSDITDVLYDTMTADLDEDEQYILKVDLKAAAAESDSGDTAKKEFNWWLIPSIIFSAALLLAIIGIVVRKLIDSQANKTIKYEKVTGYDRKQTLNRIHNDATANSGERVPVAADDKLYEEFDDILPPAPSKLKNKEVPLEKETVATVDTEQQKDTAPEVNEASTIETKEAGKKATDSYIDEFDD